MNSVIRCKTTILPLLIAGVLACFAISPMARAVVPPPDGGYPGFNSAEGQNALFSLTTGVANTGVGWFSLRSVTTGSLNTGVGAGTLLANTADNNTATGAGALLNNTTGTANTADGIFALFSNTVGNSETAVGFQALFSNTTGDANTAVGRDALYSTTGSFNTGVGYVALNNNITGNFNTAIGSNAGSSVATASSVICIGADVFGADVSNTTWIGNVYGVTTQSGTTSSVIVSDTGQLGTVASSARFKKDIATMDKASEVILSLKPVTFHYKSDAKSTAQFGLIAEEVAKVNPTLVLPDKEGNPYTVRYDAVNAMLLNEFLKEHRTVQEQGATIGELKREIANLRTTVKEQATQIQKVSARIEMNERASQTVAER